MDNTVIKVDIVEFTFELASEWLSRYNEKNRKIRKWQVRFLSSEMMRGRFSDTVSIALGQVGENTPVLVNGQHTLSAIVACKKPIKLVAVWHRVENQAGLNALYAHYDIGLKRTFSDAVLYYGVVDELDSPPSTIGKLAAALKWLASGFATSRQISANAGFSNEDVIEWIYKWHPFWKEYRNIISPCTTGVRNRLETRVIASAALLTFRDNRDGAVKFWRQVAQDDGLAGNDPRHAFHKKLIEFSAYTQTSVGLYTYVGQTEISAMAAWTWNKYYQNKKMKVLRVPKSFQDKPFLLGTDLNTQEYNHDDLISMVNF